MSTYTSSNPVPVDSPFAKMLANRPELPFIVGLPPISIGLNDLAADVYSKAAAVLGLNGNDPEFIARRVRHLAYIVRQSRFAAKATWRSALEAVDSLTPIVDEQDGLRNIKQANSFLSYSLIKTSSPADQKMLWRISVTGTTPSLTAYVDGAAVASFNATSGPVAIGDSGYSISYKNSGGSGDAVEFSAELVVPYIGDCGPIYSAVRKSSDLITQIAYNKADYLNAIFTDGIVEDAIAAFILAVDEY